MLPTDLVNSAGSLVLDTGYGADRGYLEPDDGRLDEPGEVFGWSGCAVLLRREYLEDIGTLDERLFLYYEDFDLAWRGRARGWRCLYAPSRSSIMSTVRPRAASLGSPSTARRNRLVVHTKNAPRKLLFDVYGDALRALALHMVRDVISRALHGEEARPGLRRAEVCGSGGLRCATPGRARCASGHPVSSDDRRRDATRVDRTVEAGERADR